jgi:phosphomannomutase/phosphoglucomutase
MNGLKWIIHNRPPSPHDVAAMAQIASTNARSPSNARTLDVSFDYVAGLQEMFVDSLDAQLRVVVDPMHGCWAEKSRRYLHAIFPQSLFSTIRDTIDPQFGGHAPDCSQSDELAPLCDAVYRERAHLGIAFDGDGDRMAVVDGDGVVLSPEETLLAILHCLGDQLRGEPFIYDLKYSDRIVDAAKNYGAQPTPERSGHAFLRARMAETNAILGAEVSGHYFHRALNGSEDGFYTACLLIAYLARSGKTLSQLRRECPPIYMTPDVRVAVPPDRHANIIEQIRQAWAEFPQQTIDGVRIDLPGGWALVRSSVTEPLLTFRFEGLDWPALDDLVDRFCDTVPEFGDEVWARCRAAIGSDGS